MACVASADAALSDAAQQERSAENLWQTIWFKSGVALLLFGTVAWGVRSLSSRKTQDRRQGAEQQPLASERSRITKEMRDDLNARLTQITSLRDIVEKCDDAGPQTKTHVDRIAGVSRELVQNLDAIVWAADPEKDTLNQIVSYLHDYANRHISAAGIKGIFDVPSNLPCCSVPSQVRYDLFMAVKEAVNNAVKHSQGTEIQFTISLYGPEIVVVIADNGHGFECKSEQSSGKGLQKMADRMKRISGRVEKKSAPDTGTRICLSALLQLRDAA